MTTPLPKNFPEPGWIQESDTDAARELLPSEAELVPHSHYGQAPQLNGVPLKEAAVFGLYQFKPSWSFPTTRIRANESRQNYSVMPRTEYFDVLRKCTDCSRWFVFFAKEQQYWFEELKFYVDSDCVRCADCRRQHRRRNEAQGRFAATLAESNPDSEQVTQLLADTLHLWKDGVLKKRHQLDKVIAKASAVNPSDQLLEQVRQLRQKQGMPNSSEADSLHSDDGFSTGTNTE